MKIIYPDYEKMLAKFTDTDLAALDNMIEANDFKYQIRKEMIIMGPGIIRLLNSKDIKIKSIGAAERLHQLSHIMKATGQMAPPGAQGVFIGLEKVLYIMVPAPGVIVHELGHALDFSFAKDPLPEWYQPEKILDYKISQLAEIKSFSTQDNQETLDAIKGNGIAPSAYGETNPQEFWAEAVRSYCNVNDTKSLFDEISATKYRCTNRSSYAYISSIFHKYNGRGFERLRYSV